ncbi:MAG: hypothetical protein V2J42_11225 [Wenzhouxiangella sp.]|jgi:hypothetical protein|nr:hypothetical protein [Wenzhouxiangella sp.]
MTRRYRLFLIVLGIALACAGSPVHGCSSHSSQEADQHKHAETATSSSSETGCPFHDAQEKDSESLTADAPAADSQADCCFTDCGCGCGGPVPVPVATLAGEAAPDHGTAIAAPDLFDPCSSPERLLRPPQTWA